MIDTEHGSGDLYADIADYDIITLTPPYAPKNYLDAIKAAEEAGYEVIIIDSLSHAWQDEGGLLDQADKKASSTDRFRVWAELTPQHRSLVNAMLNSPAHIIGTMRSKQGYAMEQDPKTGKTNIKKVGLAPVQREGMEYEFTVFMDIDQNHIATTTKDRTNMFADEVFQINEGIGERILNWLNSGKEDPQLQKKEIVRELTRLGVYQLRPEEKNDAAEFLQDAVKQLTELDLTPDNYGKIIAALKEWTDKEKAQSLTFKKDKDADESPKDDGEAPGADAGPEADEQDEPQGLDPKEAEVDTSSDNDGDEPKK